MDAVILLWGVIRILQGVQNFWFLNCCNIAKKISIGLEIKIKCIDHYISLKRTLFSDEDLDLSVSASLSEQSNNTMIYGENP